MSNAFPFDEPLRVARGVAHSNSLQTELVRLFQQGELCDVALWVNGDRCVQELWPLIFFFIFLHVFVSTCFVIYFLLPFPVCDHSYAAHRLVLAATCPYFRAMLHSGLAESAMRDIHLVLDQASAAVFDKLLAFLYTGELEVTTEASLFAILHLADQYQLESLLDMCCEAMTSSCAVTDTVCLCYFA